jgi:hypothetical protein
MNTKTSKLRAAGGYLNPAFLLCVGLLGVSIGIYEWKGWIVVKDPLPLKKPLELLDEEKLFPYVVPEKGRGQIENEDVIETLGTEEYIQWMLEDTSVDADSPVRWVSLFITYYDRPDNVPHVPEECYVGGGNQLMSSEAVDLAIDSRRGQRNYTMRYLIFSGAAANLFGTAEEFPVMYIFSVNGRYASGRNDARMMLNANIFSKYAYFSKIEWKFFNRRYGDRLVYPDREEAKQASERLLGVLLDVLEEDHLPSGAWSEEQK